MDKPIPREPMMEMFLYETFQMIAQLEQTILTVEECSSLDLSSINEIFRIMHTIKGSSSMMMFDNIASLAHCVEDLFYFLREVNPDLADIGQVCDVVLPSIDFIKREIDKVQDDQPTDGDPQEIIFSIQEVLRIMKSDETASPEPPAAVEQRFYISAVKNPTNSANARYQAIVWFEDGCEMENIRAFNVARKLQGAAESVEYFPPDILENSSSVDVIKEKGFELNFKSDLSVDEIVNLIKNADLVRDVTINEIEETAVSPVVGKGTGQIILDDIEEDAAAERNRRPSGDAASASGARQNIISVNVHKLDNLVDLVGELVTSEAMVTLNPDLLAVSNLDSFTKAARQHRKIINELQDIVMSIRMVPLAPTFQKMRRIVRDMSKKLHKEVELQIIGEETEVDKNIIEHLSDPLMHLIRNAIDHGIEEQAERLASGKPAVGTIKLEAKSEGGEVLISIKDDGAGMNKDKILDRIKEMGLINHTDTKMSDREIFSYILLPGFSTKDVISEYSGRGVGMDVVMQNIEAVGGTILVDSTPGEGSTILLKIPLTLAIINGMMVRVGRSVYIVPTKSIKETLRPVQTNIIHDPDGREMIMVRGDCRPVLRLKDRFGATLGLDRIDDGIIVTVEDDGKQLCLFADAILGEQQVVVKPMPRYLKKVSGISGCTLLGNGSASLIIDTVCLINE